MLPMPCIRKRTGSTAARIMEVTPEMADAFMGAAEIDKAGAVLVPGNSEHDPGTRTILFTDIVGSTDMTQELGDDVAFEMLEVHDRVVRAALSATGDARSSIRATGSWPLSFRGVGGSLRHDGAAKYLSPSQRHPNPPLRVRIGVAAGEPIEHHNDLFGSTVQLAARLCAHAEPEQILVSNTVAELCVGKSLPLRDVGAVALKGFDQPVRAHCIVFA